MTIDTTTTIQALSLINTETGEEHKFQSPEDAIKALEANGAKLVGSEEFAREIIKEHFEAYCVVTTEIMEETLQRVKALHPEASETVQTMFYAMASIKLAKLNAGFREVLTARLNAVQTSQELPTAPSSKATH